VRWTERQRAMLGEMGIRLFEADPHLRDRETMAEAEQDRSPLPPAKRGVGAPAAAPSGRHATTPPNTPASPGVRLDALHIAQLDWPALREAVAGCQACRLCEGRTNTVFGVGHERAHWMIVGEAPGEQEDLRGEPFVGKAGQLLDNMLAAIGLSRAAGPPERQVFIANTLKCRPPGNRNPQPDELAQCEPFLMRQVALLRPKMILAMGRFAVQSLLRSSEPVGRLRGRVHRWQGVPLIVTYHPAYLLRSPEDKARAWEDLCLALEVAAQSGAEALPA
jgi:uracil-DNA glycosylase